MAEEPQEQGFHFSSEFLPPDIDSILTLSERDWLLMRRPFGTEREEDGEVPLGARYVRGMLLTRPDLVSGTMDHPD